MDSPLVIVQMGEPPAAVAAEVGKQYQWFVSKLGLQMREFILIRPYRGDALPDPGNLSAVIITGSWSMVTDHAPWSEMTAVWVREIHQRAIPLLGVCYGHQLIAYALGGTVADNPHGWEGGLQQVQMIGQEEADPLFFGLPRQFTAWLSHRQTVVCPPAQARVLACSSQDACQILRYGPYAYSLQFHPEFNQALMVSCLRHSRHPGARERLPAVSAAAEPEWPALILRRFQDVWRHRGRTLEAGDAA
ncbi:glutamine amidotransferase [Martelella alba]|uniref:Glutamine amidotransferase n=1 Tax=Martelella alba TaxID=2590451 RepID=A0ABY2SLU7_9HYPH|nr:glutamine amidotransferase [Martelella alba]